MADVDPRENADWHSVSDKAMARSKSASLRLSWLVMKRAHVYCTGS